MSAPHALSDWRSRHQALWARKPALRDYYEGEYFARIVADLPPGPVLEIGAGPGFYSRYKRADIVTDISPAAHVDQVVDAHAMPFADGAFGAVVGIDVVHHFAQPLVAFQEIARILRPGGRLVLIEPWTGWLGTLFCRYLHHEDCFAIDDPWGRVFPDGKDPMDGNATIPKTYLYDHACGLEARSGLKVLKAEPFSFFGYLSTGGFTNASLPLGLSRLIRGAERLAPAAFWRVFAVKAFFVAEKVSPACEG